MTAIDSALAEVKAAGFGEVLIKIQDGCVVLVEKTIRVKP
jgi:hypothetical protein